MLSTMDAMKSSAAVPFNSRPRLAVQTEFARYASVTTPQAIGPEVEQTIAGHTSPYPVGPSQLLDTITGVHERAIIAQSVGSELQNTNEQIAKFAPSYTKLPNDQNRTAILEHMSARTGDEFTRLLADKQTTDRIRVQAGINRDDRQLLSEVFQNYEKIETSDLLLSPTRDFSPKERNRANWRLNGLPLHPHLTLSLRTSERRLRKATSAQVPPAFPRT